MITKDQLISCIEQETALCKQIHAKLPADSLDFRLGEGMRSTIELLRYLAVCGTVSTRSMLEKSWEGARDLRSMTESMTSEQFPQAMDDQVAQIRQLLAPISEDEINDIFEILKEQTIAFDNQTWNRRYRGFMDKIKTGSVYDVAEVLRDLYRLKAEKSLSFGERQMLEKARSLIVKEIAVARRRSEEKVVAEIEKIFETN